MYSSSYFQVLCLKCNFGKPHCSQNQCFFFDIFLMAQRKNSRLYLSSNIRRYLRDNSEFWYQKNRLSESKIDQIVHYVRDASACLASLWGFIRRNFFIAWNKFDANALKWGRLNAIFVFRRVVLSKMMFNFNEYLSLSF